MAAKFRGEAVILKELMEGLSVKKSAVLRLDHGKFKGTEPKAGEMSSLTSCYFMTLSFIYSFLDSCYSLHDTKLKGLKCLSFSLSFLI